MPFGRYTKIRSLILECLVGLYLRLNGYLLISNYLLHRAVEEPFGLEAEADFLGVRFPYQREVLPDGRKQENDQQLILSPNKLLIDFIIAEVKEPSVEFNTSIRGKSGQKRLRKAVEMRGFSKPELTDTIAQTLHEQIQRKSRNTFPTYEDAALGISVRMIVFARETSKHSGERKFY